MLCILAIILTTMSRHNQSQDLVVGRRALAVSSIPECLLVSLAVVLTIGMQKTLKRKGLVRKLAAAETLGEVSVICVDKTGTLTEGKWKFLTFLETKSLLQNKIY